MGPAQVEAADRDLLDKFSSWKRANPAEGQGLEPWHILLLAFLDGPVAWFGAHGKPLPKFEPRYGIKVLALLWEAYPELGRDEDLCNQVYEDLVARAVVEVGRLRPLTQNPSATQLTAPGKRFLRDVRR
jgi:hypothetical protein